jgi:hypothetical protein
MPLPARRIAVRVAVGVLLLVIGYEVFYSIANPLGVVHYWGADYNVYMDTARRWLAGGDFYHPFTVFYPPIALLVFAPMSHLPSVLWWAIPLGTIAYVVVRQCRSDLQRVALLAALSDFALVPIVSGNGSLWVAAAIAAGNRWGWPAAFIVLKPNLAPWSLVGVRRRSFWVVLGVLAAVSVLMLPMWFEWLHALQAGQASPAWQNGTVASSRGDDYLTGLLWPPFALLWYATRVTDRRRIAMAPLPLGRLPGRRSVDAATGTSVTPATR